MGLINCPDCNKEISDSTEQCINCGCPVKKVQKEQDYQNANQNVKDIQSHPVMIKFNEYKALCEAEIAENRRKNDKLTIPSLIFAIPAIILFVMMILTIARPDDDIVKTVSLFGFIGFFIPTIILFSQSKKLDDRNKYLLADIQKTKNTLPKEVLDIIKTKDKLDNQRKYEALSSLSSSSPKCPTCGSANVQKISGTSRVISTGLFGLGSKKIGKTMECKNCGYTW